MPMYEYQCAQCGRRTEKRQKFSDAPLTECPFCGGPLKKLISAPAVQFKGGGWYADGYGSSKAAASSSGEGSGSSAKAEGGTSGDSGKSEGSTTASSADSGKSSASATSDSSSSSTASSSASNGSSAANASGK